MHNFRLENGKKIWQALWEYRHPDADCFTAQVSHALTRSLMPFMPRASIQNSKLIFNFLRLQWHATRQISPNLFLFLSRSSLDVRWWEMWRKFARGLHETIHTGSSLANVSVRSRNQWVFSAVFDRCPSTKILQKVSLQREREYNCTFWHDTKRRGLILAFSVVF